MNNPIISVIVPVYNVEKYLSRCIESILTQTFTDFELLLINDGSTDKSGRICDEYAKNDTRVKVYHNDNHGVSFSRNFGIKKALGEWIIYIDGDDYFLPNAIETLYNLALEKNYNICSGNFYIEKNGRRKIYSKSRSGKIKDNFRAWYFHKFQPRAGSTLFKTEILRNNLFDETLNRYEDAKSLFDILREHKVYFTYIPIMVYSKDSPGLSNRVNDITKDFIFSMNFENKSFWEKILLASLVKQGIQSYPEYSNLLKKKYSNYYKIILVEVFTNYVFRLYRRIKLLCIL